MRLLTPLVVVLFVLSGCAASVPTNTPAGVGASLATPSATQPTATPRPSSTSPVPTATFTPVHTPTVSPTPQAAPPANATALRLEIGAEYSTFYWLQVVSFPERFVGEKVIMEGIILEVIDPTNFRMRLPDNSPAYVVAIAPLTDLMVGDKVSVYAIMQGRVCADNGPLKMFCQILLSDARVGR